MLFAACFITLHSDCSGEFLLVLADLMTETILIWTCLVGVEMSIRGEKIVLRMMKNRETKASWGKKI